MTYKIVGTEWRTSNKTVGIVAIETDLGGWKAYIGVPDGEDEDADIAAIAAFGAKLNKLEALAFFPYLDKNKCENK